MMLRTLQSEAVGRMLDFQGRGFATALVVGQNDQDLQWKVLVYDDQGEAIVSQLMRKGELRKHNVTLFIHIKSAREPIVDVPAIYFISPTSENIQLLAADCEKGLYEGFYVHFIHPCSRPVLEELAELTVATQSVAAISKVVDQYLNFVCVEEQLFSLQMPQCFSLFHDPSQSDDVIERQIEQIASGLVSVVVSLNSLPVIRCPRGDHISHAVCSHLERLLRIIREQRNGPLSDSFTATATTSATATSRGFQRPLLIVCERSWDITSSMTHPHTYQALCHEIFGIARGQVKCEHDGQSHSFDLDTATDSFWKDARFKDIPTVSDMNDQKVAEWTNESKILDAANDNTSPFLDPSATSSLTNAMNNLPALRNKKRMLDTHINLLGATFHHMQHRKYNEFFELEEKMLQTKLLSAQDREKLYNILRDSSIGNAEDKIRLAMLFLDSLDPRAAADELPMLERAVEPQGISLSACRQWIAIKSFRANTATSQQPSLASRESRKSLFSMAETVGKRVASGVKTFMGGGNVNAPLTSLVDTLLENSSTECDMHPYFDPKLGSPGDQPVSNRRKDAFRDAIVFVVGGANYVESQGLANYCSQHVGAGRTIIYGGTDIVAPKQLIEQLATLYHKADPKQTQPQTA